ncbi:hypothetical protein CcrMagneto_gp281 [Caulobacter virus Magneto]|uniref:hypothetical protein n=1 Tax=Caulobacter virus Magneto TaxID=1211642 RepID=UPI00028B3E57|nr:hypothetical protein CcrMagneto_gp281 [Caulobacter virus Magneto]AFU87451.1 hypothetical protein CcrMagneto_gp281 [Caulobacter virus Magneto]
MTYLAGAAVTGAALSVYVFKVRAPVVRETYTHTWGYVKTDDVGETGNVIMAIAVFAAIWPLTAALGIVMGLWHVLVRTVDGAWRRKTDRRETTYVGHHPYL